VTEGSIARDFEGLITRGRSWGILGACERINMETCRKLIGSAWIYQ